MAGAGWTAADYRERLPAFALTSLAASGRGLSMRRCGAGGVDVSLPEGGRQNRCVPGLTAALMHQALASACPASTLRVACGG
jgi:hypothetical protein